MPVHEAPGDKPFNDAYWRGIHILRVLTVVYAAVTLWLRWDDLVRPRLGATVLAVLGLFSLALMVRRRRSVVLVVIEVALACAAVLLTRLVDSPEQIASGAPTVPGLFPAAGVVAAAVLTGPWGGLAAAAAVSVADLVEVGEPNRFTLHNILLLLMLGGLIGLAAQSARRAEARAREAMALRARLTERERLGRAVHDGVLQGLALIHRRGRDIGGEAAELGEIAAEQEQSLRQLVSRLAPEDTAPSGAALTRDVAGELMRLSGAGVDVTGPATPLPMAAQACDEVVAAVRAALDNVRTHAGDGAHAWVLVEDGGEEVLVTVRDNGVGMPRERLTEAAASGRMGFARSIRGRLEDLGGSAHLTSREGGGTTVRLRAPLERSGSH
ncbi:MAG: DUF5931 domain-containing protein [Micrococcales bacterium]|nr:DUF5931 domain-containing protein [Micrococcales bacterium]